MKFFKTNSIFISLLAMLTVSVFLTSCNKKEVKPELKETAYSISESDRLVLPVGIDENREDIQEYLNNLSEAEINLFKENYKVTRFLAEAGKLEAAHESLENGENISKIDLDKFLDKEELNRFNDNTDEASSRWSCQRIWLGPQPCSYPCAYWYCHWAIGQCCLWGYCFTYWYIDC